MAFYSIHPFGPRQEEWRAGVVGSAAACAWGAKVEPADLFPSLVEPVPTPEDVDQEKLRTKLLGWVESFQAK